MKEKFTDTRMDEQMQDGHNAMTIALWPSASGAKNKIVTSKLEAIAYRRVELMGFVWNSENVTKGENANNLPKRCYSKGQNSWDLK